MRCFGKKPRSALFVSDAAITETKKFAQCGSPRSSNRKANPVAAPGQIAF